MTEVTHVIASLLQKAIMAGFQAPFFLTAIASDGCLQHLKYEDGKWTELTSHGNDGEMTLPTNVFLTDTRGEVIRLVLSAEGEESLH